MVKLLSVSFLTTVSYFVATWKVIKVQVVAIVLTVWSFLHFCLTALETMDLASIKCPNQYVMVKTNHLSWYLWNLLCVLAIVKEYCQRDLSLKQRLKYCFYSNWIGFCYQDIDYHTALMFCILISSYKPFDMHKSCRNG